MESRNTKRFLRLGAALVLMALLVGPVACGDTSSGPGVQPGTITATLTSPSGPEGALLVEIVGPVTQVTQVSGQLFSATDGAATQILVVMDEAGVIRFDMSVPNIHSQPGYTIREVSGPDDVLRSDLDGYTLEFTS